MLQITEFTDSASQTCQITLEDSSDTVQFDLQFLPTQNSWYFNFAYNGLTCNGLKLVLSPNILRCFKTQIPFGLMVVANDGIDPYQVTDFVDGRVNVFILNKTEVAQFESVVYND